jgi:hypothetical protein
MIEHTLVKESGVPRAARCRTGLLLLRARAGRILSHRANAWLRRWTTPGLDSTACKCPYCGGTRYNDEEMIARLKGRFKF